MKRLITLAAAIVGITLAPSAHAGTAIFVDGLGNVTSTDVVKQLVPAGYSIDTIGRLDYPAQIWPVSGLFSATAGESIAIGVSQLDDMIYSTQGTVYVVGGSLGAMVIDQELRNLETQPNPPAPEDILFVEAGNPERPGGILSYVPYGTRIPVLETVSQPVPVTPYDVIVVTNQYDGLADFPDRPWRLLAVANAIVGASVYHNVPSYTEAFETVVNGQVPDEYVTTTVNAKGGVTTTYLVPRPLALTAPFATVAPNAVNNVNKVLTPVVNRGYSTLTPDAGPYLAPGGKLVFGKSAVDRPAVDSPGAWTPRKSVVPRPAVKHLEPQGFRSDATRGMPGPRQRRGVPATTTKIGPSPTRSVKHRLTRGDGVVRRQGFEPRTR